MTFVYFDSSALVKLVIEEPESDLAADLWDGCDAAFSSRLAYPEVRSALAAATRNRQLNTRELEKGVTSWEEFWASIRPVELTRTIERQAGQLVGDHALRGADAVHLASALCIGSPELIVATWDRRLRSGILASGLAVAPASAG